MWLVRLVCEGLWLACGWCVVGTWRACGRCVGGVCLALGVLQRCQATVLPLWQLRGCLRGPHSAPGRACWLPGFCNHASHVLLEWPGLGCPCGRRSWYLGPGHTVKSAGGLCAQSQGPTPPPNQLPHQPDASPSLSPLLLLLPAAFPPPTASLQPMHLSPVHASPVPVLPVHLSPVLPLAS